MKKETEKLDAMFVSINYNNLQDDIMCYIFKHNVEHLDILDQMFKTNILVETNGLNCNAYEYHAIIFLIKIAAITGLTYTPNYYHKKIK